MKDRGPKQWHELLQIISEAKRDLEKAIAAEKPITEGIEYHR